VDSLSECSDRLNWPYDSPRCLRLGGRLFQTCGPAAAKVLSPKLLRVQLTMSVRVSAERSCLTRTSATKVTRVLPDVDCMSSANKCTIWQPGFGRPRQWWSLLNSFHTEQWHCSACRKEWQLTDTDLCPCSETQTMSYIVKCSPVIKLSGSLSWLCSWHTCEQNTHIEAVAYSANRFSFQADAFARHTLPHSGAWTYRWTFWSIRANFAVCCFRRH